MNNITTDNQLEPTAKQKGDSLELAVEHIFSVAGFKTTRNVFIAKYEIDVLAEIGDRTVIIECKNYQKSSLTIRNLIHQWNSKNQVIQAHKIIIALAGMPIKEADYDLAAKFDIELWSQEDISEMFNLSLNPDELRKKLIEKVDLRPLTIAERYREEITYLVIKPLLSNHIVSEEILYGYFNGWLRAHILTELQFTETTAEERANLIKLFEGNKTKKEFFNLITKKRKEVEYWETVYDKLESEDVLSRDRQDYYIKHMDNLIEEYDSQEEFFQSDNYLLKTRKLISSRLQNALLLGQGCSFTIGGMMNSVRVIFTDDNYVEIYITHISKTQSGILNWVMTSQCTPHINDKDEIFAYKWVCSSLKDATEKIYRIFTEYYVISNNSQLKDAEI